MSLNDVRPGSRLPVNNVLPIPKEKLIKLIEPLSWLKGMGPGQGYTLTQHWITFRARIFAERGEGCELCGFLQAECFWSLRFTLHHCNYDRLGEERDEDVKILCGNCHNLVERPGGKPAKYWARIFEPEFAEAAARLHAPISYSEIMGYGTWAAEMYDS